MCQSILYNLLIEFQKSSFCSSMDFCSMDIIALYGFFLVQVNDINNVIETSITLHELIVNRYRCIIIIVFPS